VNHRLPKLLLTSTIRKTGQADSIIYGEKMNILDVLKNENARLYCGSRWLVIDELYSPKWEFVVYESKYRQRGSREIYRGIDEDEACEMLIGD
jgi:transposase-like protein